MEKITPDATFENVASHALSPQHLSALYYATLGFKVLPIWPNSKKPMTVNGHKAGTTDYNYINRRWGICPKANIAICTDGLLVLDIDVKGGIDGYSALKTLEEIYGKLPVTRTQMTPSGGQHLIYKTEADIPSSRNCPVPGIDVRARNGYILVDDSKIDGVGYKMDQSKIVDAPQWLVDLVLGKSYSAENGQPDLYLLQSDFESCITLNNFSDVITINGMGQSIKVQYEAKSNKFVIVQ